MVVEEPLDVTPFAVPDPILTPVGCTGRGLFLRSEDNDNKIAFLSLNKPTGII